MGWDDFPDGLLREKGGFLRAWPTPDGRDHIAETACFPEAWSPGDADRAMPQQKVP